METYSGGCHCGKVQFDVTIDLARVLACNCSICRKRGMMLTFVPEDQFTLVSGEDALADYQFASKTVHHLFCTTCGVQSFGRGTMPDGTPMVAVNVRCLDEVDLDALTPTPFDGRSL
jgi:hypothetical protein